MGWFPTHPGGLARYAYELTHELAKQGEVHFWGTDFPEVSTALPSLHLQSLALAKAPLPLRLRAIYRHAQKAKLASFRAINFHFALYSLPFTFNLPKAVPVTFSFHGPWASESEQEGARFWNIQFKRWIEVKVYRKCDRFITLSQAFADILHKDYKIPYSRIHVIPGGINTQDFQANLTRAEARDRLSFPQDRPILFTPRRLVHRVGIDKLLQAMAVVKQQVPNVWLAIAGKGPQREALEQQAQTLGLSDNVKFLGYVPDEDLPICYQAADFTVVPSQSLEGFGLILLESLASGTPVISTPVGGMPEVLCPFNESLVTGGITAEAIGDRILQFLSGELATPSRESCRAYAVENYDWQIIAPRVREVLLMPKS